ncbi:MAG: BolA family transcriptional regulator [Proteobacteria bacterium]|jgi:BolA protein|uniref:BolA family transcriptional regulator n=1 Tax=Candidatus Fonsibacter lacus TaxID=2576439 RepID=A0A845S835_9PROT|nr:BolA family transcriptional regulator [Candidatus Fonsibacter lacus]NBP59683.1 BolA family transcriptional regulator [Pseudomonadota bacterium]NBO62435.1 BolA family transcriptional regulator [Candidatus Fonsibacter lacus]NBP30891.1 BolA family transcriptional regulator [Candidatus Fonsibacter lacus]NBV39659.1 BolA family transcriptional regulator [Candidatus Fonsibacter lacus]
MSDLKYIILDKIKQNIVCENVQVNNKSHLHQHHSQSPKNNNSHFEVVISSAELKKLKTVDAHKKIYSILNEEMKNTIHSLEIKIN